MPLADAQQGSGRHLVARRPFLFAGKRYQRDEPFTSACEPLKLQHLVKSGLLRPEPGAVAYKATKRFRFAGVDYAIGDAFDAEVDPYRLRQLIRQRKVAPVLGDEAPAKPKRVQETAPAEVQPDIVHTGAGWYTVTLGERSEKVRGTEAAETMAELMVEEARGG